MHTSTHVFFAIFLEQTDVCDVLLRHTTANTFHHTSTQIFYAVFLACMGGSKLLSLRHK